MDFLDPALQSYAERHTSAEPDYLQALNRETHLKVLYPRMLSGHIQGRILALFSHMVRPLKVLEIGTYTGYSALCFAEGLAPGGKVVTIDINPELEDIIQKYVRIAGMEDKIDFLIGDAGEILPSLDGEFDLVFIDADKQNYIRYFEMVLPKLRKGGFILADNVLWSGRVLDPDENDKETTGLRNFAEHISNNDKVEHILMPIRDGIMAIRKK